MITQMLRRSTNEQRHREELSEELRECRAKLEAISQSQAVIEFDMDGTIRTANQNFQNALGYNLNEIQGQHHRIFVDPTDRESIAYQNF